MSHGGPRTGAGRKKGSSNKISAKAVIEKISAEDMKSPLEIMTHIMHQAFAEGDFEMALDAAHKAAPYMHAKLSESKIEATFRKKIEDMTDEELQYLSGDPNEEED